MCHLRSPTSPRASLAVCPPPATNFTSPRSQVHRIHHRFCQFCLLYFGLRARDFYFLSPYPNCRPSFQQGLKSQSTVDTSPHQPANRNWKMDVSARAFHPFPRLPVELREYIWELSMEPRIVAIRPLDGPRHDPYEDEQDSFAPQEFLDACEEARSALQLRYPERTPPPHLLHVCAESRSLLQRHYRKAFAVRAPPQYSWVNFDMDTVCMSDVDLKGFVAEVPLIRRLILESQYSDVFSRSCDAPLLNATALKMLTILDVDWRNGERWFRPWVSVMRTFYHGCDVVPFDTRIKRVHDPNAIEITRDNYPKAHRCRVRCPAQGHRRLLTGWERNWELSEDDVESWLIRPWPGRHVEGCNCG